MAQIKNINGEVIYEGGGSLKEVLERAVVEGVDLEGADLKEVNLEGANAYLSGADLAWAKLQFADLRGADFGGATLTGVDFYRAKGLESAIFTGAKVNLDVKAQGTPVLEYLLFQKKVAEHLEASIEKGDLRAAKLYMRELMGRYRQEGMDESA